MNPTEKSLKLLSEYFKDSKPNDINDSLSKIDKYSAKEYTSDVIQDAINNIPNENKIFAEIWADIHNVIENTINDKGYDIVADLITQEKLNLYLNTLYNFTLKEIAELEHKLNIKIININVTKI